MEDTLKIKCPICGAVLVVKRINRIETKSITCPICKTTSKFTDYKTAVEEPQAPECDSETQFSPETDPHLNLNNTVIGKLQHLESGQLYPLNIGVNTIGRKANGSAANIQIETNDRTMSRMHSVVEVVELEAGGYKHYLSNGNNKNSTFINNLKVLDQDKVILSGDETIKMANVVLKFVNKLG